MKHGGKNRQTQLPNVWFSFQTTINCFRNSVSLSSPNWKHPQHLGNQAPRGHWGRCTSLGRPRPASGDGLPDPPQKHSSKPHNMYIIVPPLHLLENTLFLFTPFYPTKKNRASLFLCFVASHLCFFHSADPSLSFATHHCRTWECSHGSFLQLQQPGRRPKRPVLGSPFLPKASVCAGG